MAQNTKIPRGLVEEWNRRLRDSGFVDVEEFKGGEWYLRQNSQNSYRQATEVEREAKLEYYLCVSHAVEEAEYDSVRDQMVMLCHSEGLSNAEISRRLYHVGILCHRMTVGYVIKRYVHRWGIREYSYAERHMVGPKCKKE